MQTPTSQDRSDAIQSSVMRLGEHFENVQIIATWVAGSQSFQSRWGCGSWQARQGMAQALIANGWRGLRFQLGSWLNFWRLGRTGRFLKIETRWLAQHYDDVQVLVSRAGRNRSTEYLVFGIGNRFSRFGMIHEFINMDMAQQIGLETSQRLNPPEEDEDCNQAA